MLNDLRQALRLFGRAPGFAAAAVVSIGLAIGANAAIFSLADALFLRPLDVPDPSGVVTLGTRPWQNDGRHSLPDYADFRAANRSFASLAAVRTVRAGISSDAGTSSGPAGRLRGDVQLPRHLRRASRGRARLQRRRGPGGRTGRRGAARPRLLGARARSGPVDRRANRAAERPAVRRHRHRARRVCPPLRPGASGLLRAGDDGALPRRRCRRPRSSPIAGSASSR